MTENKSIYAKLLAVQKEITPIKKTETNPFFNSRYFDVNAILEQLKPILTKHGLTLTQPFEIDGAGRTVLVTQVVDVETGETHRSSIYLPAVSDPQKFGSAVTYFRRYSLQSFFALQSQDDDANAVSEVASRTTPQASADTRRPLGKKTPFKAHDANGDEAHWVEGNEL